MVLVTAEAIKRLRARNGWSTYDVAKQIGCNQSTIWRIENGAKFGGVIEKALLRLIADQQQDSSPAAEQTA